MSLNKYNLTRSYYNIELRPGSAADIFPGTGFDMNDELFPEAKGRVFIPSISSNIAVNDRTVVPEENAILQSVDSHVRKQEDYRNEAKMLSVYFSGKYAIVSANIAYEKAKSEIENKTVFYLIIEIKGDEGYSLRQEDIRWRDEPNGNQIQNPDERLRQFVLQYGSHFTRRVYYGQKIIIRAVLSNRTQSEVEKLNAAIKATSTFWNASAGISAEHRTFLQSSSVEISTSIISGNIIPANARYLGDSFDGIMQLLTGLKDNTITIQSGPMECEVETFWSTLNSDRDRKLREVLYTENLTFPPMPAPYGVPKGTIVAWSPDLNTMPRSGSGDIILQAPEGWAICDGNGTPALNGRFLIGQTDPSKLAEIGGESTFTPAATFNKPVVKISANVINEQGVALLSEQSNIRLNPITNLPPYFPVVFIIKV